MVSDKKENFRITVLKKSKKWEGVRKILKFHERGSWGEKVWEPLLYLNSHCETLSLPSALYNVGTATPSNIRRKKLNTLSTN
jgi:hypothetical protein